MGEWAEAETAFTAAAATHERIAAPAWGARTAVEWARMLLARRAPDDIERAYGLLRRALDTARSRGLSGIEHDAAVLLSPPGT